MAPEQEKALKEFLKKHEEQSIFIQALMEDAFLAGWEAAKEPS